MIVYKTTNLINKKIYIPMSEIGKLSHKEAANRSEVRESNSKAQIELWKDQNYREKQIQSRTIAANKPERKEQVSKQLLKNWQDPVYRQKQIKSHTHPKWRLV